MMRIAVWSSFVVSLLVYIGFVVYGFVTLLMLGINHPMVFTPLHFGMVYSLLPFGLQSQLHCF